MALDVGDRRIGVAVSDPLQLFARPLLTIDRKRDPLVADRLRVLCQEWDVERLIVGLPLMPSGDWGEQARAVVSFVAQIDEAVAVPIDLFDESYTTVEAEEHLRAAGRGREPDKGRIDAVAAAVLLDDWLAAHPGATRETRGT